jgi:hypothetical protein
LAEVSKYYTEPPRSRAEQISQLVPSVWGGA